MFYKYAVVSDFHSPFISHKTVDHLIENHADSTDELVIVGDFFDNHLISSYVKTKTIPLMTEYIEGQKVFNRLVDEFQKVTVTGGNHDFRHERNVINKLPPELRPFLGENPLKRLVRGDVWDEENQEWKIGKGFDNVELVLDDNKDISWYYVSNNIVFAHTEKFIKNPNLVAVKTREFFVEKGYNPQCIVVGHVHRLNISYKPSCIMIENGCMCEELDYAKMHPKLSYTDQVNGYSIVCVDSDGIVMPDFTYQEAVYEVIRK